jgi:hypothetical protein
MSTATRFSYDYVLELASQLSTAERERLVQEIQEPSVEVPNYGSKMVEYTVPGKPIISPEELEEIRRIGERHQRKRTPEELKESRQRLMEILLNCPVMTDEDLKGFEEARKEINECRLAYL